MKDIATLIEKKFWWFKEQFASCISICAALIRKLFAKKMLKIWNQVKNPLQQAAKQACEDNIFTSTAHEGKQESLQTVQYKKYFEICT